MRKATRNYIMFVALLLLGLFETLSGFVLWFALPREGGGRRGVDSISQDAFWSLSRPTWTELHDWVAVALLAVVVIHIVLHWRWIVYMTKSFFKGKS